MAKWVLLGIVIALVIWTIFDPITDEQRLRRCQRIDFKSFACDRFSYR